MGVLVAQGGSLLLKRDMSKPQGLFNRGKTKSSEGGKKIDARRKRDFQRGWVGLRSRPLEVEQEKDWGRSCNFFTGEGKPVSDKSNVYFGEGRAPCLRDRRRSVCTLDRKGERSLSGERGRDTYLWKAEFAKKNIFGGDSDEEASAACKHFHS